MISCILCYVLVLKTDLISSVVYVFTPVSGLTTFSKWFIVWWLHPCKDWRFDYDFHLSHVIVVHMSHLNFELLVWVVRSSSTIKNLFKNIIFSPIITKSPWNFDTAVIVSCSLWNIFFIWIRFKYLLSELFLE